MPTITRRTATSVDARCDLCPGVMVLWQDRAKHVIHLLPNPAATPTPAPTTPPKTGLLEIGWHHGWSGPRLRDYPADAVPDLVVWAMGQAGEKGTGKITGPPLPSKGYTVDEARADIAALASKGRPTLLGFGGSNDGGITIIDAATVQQAFSTIVAHVDRFGLGGVSIDLEPSGGRWTQDAIVELIRLLKARYGAGFHVDVCVALYDPHTARWIALAKALGSLMDTMSVMLYDFIQASDARLTEVSIDKVRKLSDGGVDPSKVVLLYMMRPDPGYANSTPNPQLIVDAVRATLTKHPTLRGVGWWEDKINAARGWDGPKALASAGLT